MLNSYPKFKQLSESLAVISCYKIFFCFKENLFIDDSSNNRCEHGVNGELCIFSLYDTLIDLVEKNYEYLNFNYINIYQRKERTHTNSESYDQLWSDVDIEDETIRITLLLNVDDA